MSEEQTKPKNTRIGALWSRQSQTSQQKYLAGTIEITDDFGEKKTQKVVVFKNNRKDTDRHPDYNIYKAREPDAQKATVPEESTEDSSEELL